MPGCFTRSGGRGCSSTTRWSGSIGTGWQPTARWRKRRWAVTALVPIPPIGRKGGETFASLRDARGADRAGARRRQPPRLEAASADARLDPDHAARAEREAAAGALPRPRPRLPVGQGTCRGLPPGAAHPRPRRRVRDRLTTPGWRARRWVVEACHSWLNRNRSLLIRWSKKPQNHLALLQLACGLIAFKKAQTARLAHALAG